MRADDLLQVLHAHGATIHLIGDRLRVEGPTGAITPQLRAAIREQRGEIIAFLTDSGAAPLPPESGATPQHLALASEREMAGVRSRFAQHGTQPAWDDLCGAARLERQRTWCTDTLDAVYRGTMTLAFTPVGNLIAHPRGLSH